jgi:Xaa-Pro aminopeptidase
MNIAIVEDYKEKQKRIRVYMIEHGYDYAVLSKQENFAWFTCGGDNKVLRNTDEGVGILVISQNSVTCVAYYMDSDRIHDDELRGLDIEQKMIYWHEGGRLENAVKLTSGRIVSDTDIPGTDNRHDDILRLHYPLTENEVKKYRKFGVLCDKLLVEIAENIRPGMTEHEIEAKILYAYGREGMTLKVLLVGTDERIEKYRHPNASSKRLERLALIHPAAEKGTLHANITRMIYFGDRLPKDLEEKYELLNMLQAQFFCMAKTGARFRDIYELRRKTLADRGYQDEWQYHTMGCVTGYILGTDIPLIKNESVLPNMPLDMYITLKGAKVEELALTGDEGVEVLSATGKWPVKTYEYEGRIYTLPVIMMK